MLYKIHIFYFVNPQISVILLKIQLTFSSVCGMLIMLGRVYRFRLFLYLFLQELFDFVKIHRVWGQIGA